jgi:hypothetical protein
MKAASLLVGVVLLAGCTRVIDISGSEWRRPNTGHPQLTWDQVECARATEGVGDLSDTVVGGVVDAIVVPMEDRRRGAAYDRCMTAKGYAPVAAR